MFEIKSPFLFPVFASNYWSNLYITKLRRGSSEDEVVRVLASHQCDARGSIPDSALSCGLSLLLVLSSASRDFSLGNLAFPSPKKPTLINSNSIRNRGS